MHRQLVATILVLCIAIATVGVGFSGSAVASGGDAALASDADEICDYPMTLEDATGEAVTIDAEPERIVALHPSVAQVLWEVEANDRVVGMPVTDHTAYLDGYDEPANVYGDDGFPSNERVIDADPDLVIASGAHDPERIDALREAGLTVYAFPPSSSIDDVREKTLTIGALVGACENATAIVSWMDERLDAVEATVADEERPVVYYAMGDGWTVGSGTFQDEMIAAAGGENLGALAGIEAWGQLSDEVVVEEDPEWIVYGDSWDEPPVTEATMNTTAMQADQTVVVNAQYINQDGPRIVYAIEEMAAAFHPDTAGESEETSTPTETATPEPTTDEPAEEAAATGAQPGFGVVVSLLALIVAAGFFRRS